MNTPNKRFKISHNSYSMVQVKNALDESIFDNKTNDLYIEIAKQKESIDTLTKEVKKLTETINFFMETILELKNTQIPNNIETQSSYIS